MTRALQDGSQPMDKGWLTSGLTYTLGNMIHPMEILYRSLQPIRETRSLVNTNSTCWFESPPKNCSNIVLLFTNAWDTLCHTGRHIHIDGKSIKSLGLTNSAQDYSHACLVLGRNNQPWLKRRADFYTPYWLKLTGASQGFLVHVTSTIIPSLHAYHGTD